MGTIEKVLLWSAGIGGAIVIIGAVRRLAATAQSQAPTKAS